MLPFAKSRATIFKAFIVILVFFDELFAFVQLDFGSYFFCFFVVLDLDEISEWKE